MYQTSAEQRGVMNALQCFFSGEMILGVLLCCSDVSFTQPSDPIPLFDSALAAHSQVMLVKPKHPRIAVNPDSILYFLPPKASKTDSFTVKNIGGDTLHFSIKSHTAVSDTDGYSNFIIDPLRRSVDSLVRAGVYRAVESGILVDFAYVFRVLESTHIEFFVFRCRYLGGKYYKIFSRTLVLSDTSVYNFVTSGPMSVQIDSGSYYLIGVSWDRPIQYTYGISSFGNQIPSLTYVGSFERTQTFPSAGTYVILEASNNGVFYEMTSRVAYPLRLTLVSPSSGSLEPDQVARIVFIAQTGVRASGRLLSYFAIASNDPNNPTKRINVRNRMLTEVRQPSHPEIPASVHLYQNYPNPCNPSTTIHYDLPHSNFVTLKVFNILGEEVRVLVNERKDAGRHTITFNAESLPSGVYFYRLQAEHYVGTRKLLLLR